MNMSGQKSRIIVFIGMQGVGKTVLAKRLTHTLHIPVYDTDRLLEKRWSKEGVFSVREIFSKVGEERFREEELQVMKELYEYIAFNQACISVISSGGGAIKALNWLKDNAHSFQVDFIYLFEERARFVEKNVDIWSAAHGKAPVWLTSALIKAGIQRANEEDVRKILIDIWHSRHSSLSALATIRYESAIDDCHGWIEHDIISRFTLKRE